MSDTTIFEGERIAQYPEKPDVKYVVTRWRRMGRGIEALDGHKASPEELQRIRLREDRPNREVRTVDGIMFTCRTCAVEFLHSGGLVLACCPGCGTSPGFVRRRVEKVGR